MINKIIPILHLLVVIIYSFYPFIFAKNFLYDYFYYVFVIIVQLSWLYFNHECIFSYLYKKINYKNYNCGDNTTLDDFNELTGKNQNKDPNSIDYGKLIDNVFLIFYILSVIIVGYRSKIANIYLIIFVLIIVKYFYLFLNDAIGWDKKLLLKSNYIIFKNLYKKYQIKSIHNEINNLVTIIMIAFFIYITYKNRKRFYNIIYNNE
jgi:hypothetical protein